MKTINQEEAISRSRFTNCPVCENHTLKLKRVVQVGRCKTCAESYKIITLYVKTGKRQKPPPANVSAHPETKPESTQESTLPSWQIPSDTSLFGTSNDNLSGFSNTDLKFGDPEKGTEPQPTSGQ